MTLNKLQNDSVVRYVFSPLFTVDFRMGQHLCPLSNPLIERFKFVPLYPITYMTQNASKDEYTMTSDDLIEEILGTPAQISYLLGDMEGGNYAKGLTYLKSFDNLPLKQVKDIEASVFGNYTHVSLIQLHKFLTEKREKFPASFVQDAFEEMLNGVTRAIRYCENFLKNTEEEITNARTGRPAFKTSLEETDYWLYREIERTPMEMIKQSSSLAQILSEILNKEQTITSEEFRRLQEENNRLKEQLAMFYTGNPSVSTSKVINKLRKNMQGGDTNAG